jgi:hypothetical protein
MWDFPGKKAVVVTGRPTPTFSFMIRQSVIYLPHPHFSNVFITLTNRREVGCDDVVWINLAQVRDQ